MKLFQVICLTISGIWTIVFMGLTFGLWHTDFYWVYLTFFIMGFIFFIMFVVIYWMSDD